MRKGNFHIGGKGLRPLSSEQWYGPGYCGICGDRGESLVPQAVRFWDPDDGWKMGVLCVGCGADARENGPKQEDYAYQTANPIKIDIEASMGDLDAAWSNNS